MPERSWSSKPFRAFPSPGAVTSLDARCPPVVHQHRMLPVSRGIPTATPPSDHAAPWLASRHDPEPVHGLPTKSSARLDFRALLPGTSPLHCRRRLGWRRARCSPGVLPRWVDACASAHRHAYRCCAQVPLAVLSRPRPEGHDQDRGAASCKSDATETSTATRPVRAAPTSRRPTSSSSSAVREERCPGS
jgi:hypothetical protein